MSAKTTKTSQREWTTYAVLMLLVLVVTAVSTAMLVPPAWRAVIDRSQTTEPIVRSPAPLFDGPSVDSQPGLKSVCGLWRSGNSRKQYGFICQQQNAFKIHEINGQGPNNTGSGKVTEDGKVEAHLLILPKKRTAHLKLQLSADGQKLEGTWNGDDPREAGQLTFHRVEKD